MIRLAKLSDAQAIADIYNHYIQHTVVTFEEDCVTLDEMAGRMENVRESGFPWFVAEADEKIAGYAYAGRWSGRCAYRYTAEVTVYLAPDATGKGWGTQLYDSLFKALTRMSFHAVIGGVTLPNAASVALHEKFGMRKVAHFPEVGYKFDCWLDVGYWQTMLANCPRL